MRILSAKSGRIKIDMVFVEAGEDLCVIISGGDQPHIGCVTVSVPRQSLADPKARSATTSVINIAGHKDDEAAKIVSHELSAELNKNVIVTCGIHLDHITNEEIDTVIRLVTQLKAEYLSLVN